VAAGEASAVSLRIVADRDRCVGGGLCVLTEPSLFDQSEDGRVVLREERPAPDQVDAARTAVDVCPARALSFRED
jgi:ferredoxin